MRLLLAFLATALFSACSLNRAYIPVVQPTPLFKKAGDFYLAASQQSERGINTQGGIAISNRLGMIAAGTYGQKDNCFSCSKEVARHIEIGLGVYRPESDWMQEAFIGGGVGRLTLLNAEGWDPNDEEMTILSSRYSSAFIQGNIGKTGRIFDRVFSTRVSAFDFYDLSRKNGGGVPLTVPTHYWAAFAEPAFTLRAGYRYLKAESQIGFSIPVFQESGFDNQKIWISFGLSLRKFRVGK